MSKVDLKLIIAMARSYNQLFSTLERHFQEMGLNGSEFGVLECLYHKGEQPVQKVAEKILVTSGTITYVIDKLQKKGLVVRKRCDKDKRIYYVHLTDEGYSLMCQLFPKHEAYLEELFSELPEIWKCQLIENLVDLQNAIK